MRLMYDLARRSDNAESNLKVFRSTVPAKCVGQYRVVHLVEDPKLFTTTIYRVLESGKG